MTPPASPRSSSQDSGSSGADFAAFLEAQLDVDEFEEGPELVHETGTVVSEEEVHLDVPPEDDAIGILNPEPEPPVSDSARSNPESKNYSLREADTAVAESWEETRGDSGGRGEEGVSLGGQKRKWTVEDSTVNTINGALTEDAVGGGAALPSEMGPSGSDTCPPHPGFMWEVCIRCGQAKGEEEAEEGVGGTGVALRYIHARYEVSPQEAARLKHAELAAISANRKLFLVLDLDHTLLNSARFLEVSEDHAAYFRTIVGRPNGGPPADPNLPPPSLFEIPEFHMWTKLRPGVHEFLEASSRLFQLAVYTNGERGYAEAMARILDPRGGLFEGRVISHGDSTRQGMKDLDVVLGEERAVLILDDTEQVWPRHRANLLVVERYHYFQSSQMQFGLTAPSLVDRRRDESPTHGALATLLEVLRKVHGRFFEEKDAIAGGAKVEEPDVRNILRSVQSEILSGCHLAFSRVFPLDYPHPESHPLWRMAVEMGATCHSETGPGVTHVLAREPGTAKAQWARAAGKFLVAPGWLEGSRFLWKRLEEWQFAVAPKNV